MAYNVWTVEEINLLVKEWNADTPLLDIAAKLPQHSGTDNIRRKVELLRKRGVEMRHRPRSCRPDLSPEAAAERAAIMRESKQAWERMLRGLAPKFHSADLFPPEGTIIFTDNVKTVAVGKLGQSPLNRSYGTASSWAVRDGV